MNPYHITNICIFGVGSVGGVFGGKIAKAISQEKDTDRKVFFIARGAHLEEIKRNGLILNTPEERGIVCNPTMATDNIEEIPQPDLCLLCVKGYDLDDATIAIKTNIGTHTLVIPLLQRCGHL